MWFSNKTMFSWIPLVSFVCFCSYSCCLCICVLYCVPLFVLCFIWFSFVVFIVSLGKLFTMSMGCLNNIITNSKYYIYVFWFSIVSAVLAVVLNLYLINELGIIGAAYATLIVIVLNNVAKILLIQFTFKINPFSNKTFFTLGIILLLYVLIPLIPLDFSPFLSLVIRSLVIVITFLIFSRVFKLTGDFQNVVNKFNFLKKK